MTNKIEILGAEAPTWANEEQTAITLKVRFSHLKMTIPFTATPSDTEEHGRELWSRARFGEYGEIAPYSGPTKEQQEMATFPRRQKAELSRLDALIAPLERARRLGMATPDEVDELEALERHSVLVMRAEGPELPVFSFAH